MRLPWLLVALAAISAASLALADDRAPPVQTAGINSSSTNMMQPAATTNVAPSPPAPASAPARISAPTAADTPAPAAAAPAPGAAETNGGHYPAANCVTPNYPGKTGTDEQVLAFNRDFKNYGDCIRKYVDDARNMSNAAIEAGNKAVLEYNKYADDVRKQIAADKAAK